MYLYDLLEGFICPKHDKPIFRNECFVYSHISCHDLIQTLLSHLWHWRLYHHWTSFVIKEFYSGFLCPFFYLRYNTIKSIGDSVTKNIIPSHDDHSYYSWISLVCCTFVFLTSWFFCGVLKVNFMKNLIIVVNNT